jgi:hypothetical protein
MLPNLLIIGAMKCGTTSLHYYLGLHPEIFMSEEKELRFFVAERNWPKGVAWYESQFPVDAPIRGEASPSYTMHPLYEGVPERMHGIVPDAKLIYVLRDPVERLVSNYRHACAEGQETRPFDDAVLSPGNPYLSRSLYATQLEKYLPFYPLSRILVLTQEDLKNDRRATLRRVFRYLGVDDSFASWKFALELHDSRWKRRVGALGKAVERSTARAPLHRLPRIARRPAQKLITMPFSRGVPRPELSSDTRRLVAESLREDTRRLREITGLALDHWSV